MKIGCGREARPSFASALGWVAEEFRPEVSGLGIAETRASRVSSAVALIGSALGGVHGATFMFDATERETQNDLERMNTMRISRASQAAQMSFTPAARVSLRRDSRSKSAKEPRARPASKSLHSEPRSVTDPARHHHHTENV